MRSKNRLYNDNLRATLDHEYRKGMRIRHKEGYYDEKCLDVRFPSHEYMEAGEVTVTYLTK